MISTTLYLENGAKIDKTACLSGAVKLARKEHGQKNCLHALPALARYKKKGLRGSAEKARLVVSLTSFFFFFFIIHVPFLSVVREW